MRAFRLGLFAFDLINKNNVQMSTYMSGLRDKLNFN
jgi:hypothetical protein